MAESILDSDVYPMTGANQLYNLIRQSIEDEEERKKETNKVPVKISQSVLASAFKFLQQYNKSQMNGTKKQEKTGSNCVTVYSSPCSSSSGGGGGNNLKSRKAQGSTELPTYVKKMMEKDASLRRLLRTGSVTISHIPNPAKHSGDNGTKGTAGARTAENCSNGSNHQNSNNNSKTNCRSSNLLKLLAKKAHQKNTSQEESDVSAPAGHQIQPGIVIDQALGVKNAMITKLLQPGSSKASKKRKLDDVVQDGNSRSCSTDSGDDREDIANDDDDIMEDEELAVECGAFDPTKFLEVSFREEESDEHRRKYKCPHCVKKFCWSTDLKRHILTHTGERPFSCEFCPANFTRKFLMQKHTRKHHQDKLSLNGSRAKETNGHCRVIKTEAEDDEERMDEGESPHDSESEQFYGSRLNDDNSAVISAEVNSKPEPIVINVFSSMRENNEGEDSNSQESKSKLISLAAGATISTKGYVNPSLLTQLGKASVDRCPSSSNSNNRNSDQKLITLVNS